MTKTEKLEGYSYKYLSRMRNTDKFQDAYEHATEQLQRWVTEDDYWSDCVISDWKGDLAAIGFDGVEISYDVSYCQGSGSSFTATVDMSVLTSYMSKRWGDLARELTATKLYGVYDKKSGAGRLEKATSNRIEQLQQQLFLRKKVPIKRDSRYTRLCWLADSGFIADIGVNRAAGCRYSHESTCSFQASLQDDGEYRYPGNWDRQNWVSTSPRTRKLYEAFKEEVEDMRLDICHKIQKELEGAYEDVQSGESLLDMCEANDYRFDVDGRLM